MWIISIAIRVSGTLIQKTSRQVLSSHTTAMPYSGPSTLPSSWAAPIPPRTIARLRAAQRSAARARVTGSSAPLATPWISRPITRVVRSSDSAVTTEPTANPTRLSCSTSLRPKRSESRPSSGIAAMYPSRYQVMIGVTCWILFTGMPMSRMMSTMIVTTT